MYYRGLRHNMAPHPASGDDPKHRTEQLCDGVGDDPCSGEDSEPPHGQRDGRIRVPPGGPSQRVENQPGEQKGDSSTHDPEFRMDPRDRP
jgi:hypothetical protein